MRFQNELNHRTLQCIQSSFEYCFPCYTFHFTSNRLGVVIKTDSVFENLDPNQLKCWFDFYDHSSSILGPRLPPSNVERFTVRARHYGAETMWVLAVLGWILPVMPGTPFFLIAWSLGWRPPGSKPSAIADQNEE